jgi:hypothetical protein
MVKVLWVDKDVHNEVRDLRKLLGKNSSVYYEMDSFMAYVQYRPEELDVLVLDASQDEVFTSKEIGREDYYHFSEHWKNKNPNLYIIATSVMGGTFMLSEFRELAAKYDQRISIGFPTCPNRRASAQRVFEILSENNKILFI